MVPHKRLIVERERGRRPALKQKVILMGNRFSSTLSNLDDADIDQLLASLSLRFDR